MLRHRFHAENTLHDQAQESRCTQTMWCSNQHQPHKSVYVYDECIHFLTMARNIAFPIERRDGSCSDALCIHSNTFLRYFPYASLQNTAYMLLTTPTHMRCSHYCINIVKSSLLRAGRFRRRLPTTYLYTRNNTPHNGCTEIERKPIISRRSL